LNIKKYLEVVYFPPFYDPKHQIWAFSLFGSKSKISGKQTKHEKIITETKYAKYDNFSLTCIHQLTRTLIEQKL
jgi:hypothetical protein